MPAIMHVHRQDGHTAGSRPRNDEARRSGLRLQLGGEGQAKTAAMRSRSTAGMSAKIGCVASLLLSR